jgi:hypothetical protein
MSLPVFLFFTCEFTYEFFSFFTYEFICLFVFLPICLFVFTCVFIYEFTCVVQVGEELIGQDRADYMHSAPGQGPGLFKPVDFCFQVGPIFNFVSGEFCVFHVYNKINK